MSWQLKFDLCGAKKLVLSTLLAVACLSVLIEKQTAHATTMSLLATQDTWTPTLKTDTSTHDNTGIQMKAGTGATAQGGWLQFDLSQLPAGATITSAHIDLYLVSASSTNNSNISITGSTQSNAAGTITIDDSTFNRVTYSDNGLFDTPLGLNEADNTLGDFAAGVLGNGGSLPTLNQFYSSSNANAADLTLLQSIYGSAGSLVVQLYAPNITGTHFRTFEDHEGSLTGNSANGPQLVVTYTLAPEPSTVVMCGMALAGILLARKRG